MSRRLFAILGLVLVSSSVTLVGCDSAPSSGTSQAPVGHTGMPPGTSGTTAGGPAGGAAAPAAKK
jgi:hypothetical protein